MQWYDSSDSTKGSNMLFSKFNFPILLLGGNSDSKQAVGSIKQVFLSILKKRQSNIIETKIILGNCMVWRLML